MEKKFIVKVIHEFLVEAETEEEAEQIVLDKNGYGEARDCYFEIEKAQEKEYENGH